MFTQKWPLTWAFFILIFSSFAISLSIPRKDLLATENPETSLESRTSAVDLRILCLGASITFGVGSTTGNGYRKDLRDLLSNAGHAVHFVGTQSSGNMQNNANEGYPGMRIDQVSGFGWNSYGYLPNVVLVHLGTNDCNQGYEPSGAASRMGTLIDQIHSAIPGTLVVASKLLPNKKPIEEQCIQDLNSLLDDIVNSRTAKGINVKLVDMHSSQFSLSDLGPDGTHPTDEGYQKMAGVWFQAIDDAIGSDKVPPLKSTGVSDAENGDNNRCPLTASSVSSPGTSQFGFGDKTSLFQGAWINVGVIMTDRSANEKGIFWADLTGNGLDDYVHIDSHGSMTMAPNNGGEKLGAITSVASPPACDISGVRFFDMSGDGIADYICIAADGSMTAFITASGSTPTWGSPTITKSSAGNPRASVFIADMDGDGLGDYISVASDGSVSVFYNRGSYGPWIGPYAVFTIPGYDAASTHFFDVNGDRRADVINVAQDGTITGFLNYRGSSLVQPDFRDTGTIMRAIAHADIKSNEMTFGRIRGTQKMDLATLHPDGKIKLFENKGYSGIAYGEYCRYCDMTNSGSDSFLTMGPSGSLKFYQNLHNGGIHLKYGEILEDQGLARDDVHLADLDADGKCDYIIVNNRTGALQWRKNEGMAISGLNASLSLSGPSALPLANDPGCDRSGVRFADVSGDRRADYICITKSGNVHIGINNGGGFGVSGPVFSVSDDIEKAGSRDSITFADIDADGYADYLFFDSAAGSVTARLNTNKGQSFGDAHVIYSDPSFVGGFLRFANMNGLGRADMVNIVPLSGKAKTSSNRCPHPTPPTGIGPNPNPPADSSPPPAEIIPGGADYSVFDDISSGSDGIEPTFVYCTGGQSYTTVESVLNDASVDPQCVNGYLLYALANNLSRTLDTYRAIEANDYKSNFDLYQQAFKTSLPGKFDKFYQKEMDDYFTCNYANDWDQAHSHQNVTGQGCPPNKAPAFFDDNSRPLDDVYFVATDLAGFNKTLEKSYNIDRAWVIPSKKSNQRNCNHVGCISGSCTFYTYGVDPDIVIPDPADTITKSLKTYTGLADWIYDVAFDVEMDLFWGEAADVVDAVSMSVYTVVAAVHSMQNVVTIGEEIKKEIAKEQELNLILAFISAILLFLPGIGEELDAVLDATLYGRLAAYVSSAGDAAQNIYNIVTEPNNSLMAIGGLLTDGVGSRVGSVFEKAGAARRSLSEDVISGMGKEVSDGMALLKAGYKKCEKR